MAKNKNALRKHYVAPWSKETPDTEPQNGAWLWLAKDITESAPENDEEVDESADFTGDGTPISTVTSVKRGRSFTGWRNPEDAAQNFIADMEDKLGEGRFCWYKEVSADGKTQKVGVATVSEIEIGDGEASEYESFACKITWNSLPKKTAVVGGK